VGGNIIQSEKIARAELLVSKDQPAPAIETKTEARRGDGLFVVLQNNAEKSLIIHRINEAAEEMLGYSAGEALGRKLETVLGPRTAEFLGEELEYRDDAPDLGDVLSKQREIRLRHHSGKEIPTICTISRMMAQGPNACFQMVIPNQHEALGRKKIRDFIALNLDGRKQLDEALGIPDRTTALAFLPLLKNYLTESGIEAAFSVIRMDRFEKSMARYGKDGCVQMLHHMSNCCRASFRSEDIVFALSEKTLGILLFDISRESARLVLTRLRWKIRNHHIVFDGKSNFSITGTVIFDMVDAERGDSILTRSEEAVDAVDADERNGLVELGN
jgi:PAS domain S-box-containing protein